MALPQDSAPKFQEYAHPEMIVSTEWVAQHLDDPGLVVAESDEDVLLYETGHVPGAVKLDWHTELNDPVTRDYVDGAGFAALMSGKGIARDTTLEHGELLSNRAQLVDEKIGSGHVVLFAFRPYWRWQTQGTFILGFNSILNWNDLNAGK